MTSHKKLTTYIGFIQEYNTEGFGSLKIAGGSSGLVSFNLFSNAHAIKYKVKEKLFKGDYIGVIIDENGLIHEAFSVEDRTTVDTEFKGAV